MDENIFEEENDPIEASLEEFENELFSSMEEKRMFYQSQQKQAQKELSENRAAMQRLSESLPEKPPEPSSPQFEAYQRIQTELESLKAQVAEKNDELIQILKHLDSLSSD